MKKVNIKQKNTDTKYGNYIVSEFFLTLLDTTLYLAKIQTLKRISDLF